MLAPDTFDWAEEMDRVAAEEAADTGEIILPIRPQQPDSDVPMALEGDAAAQVAQEPAQEPAPEPAREVQVATMNRDSEVASPERGQNNSSQRDRRTNRSQRWYSRRGQRGQTGQRGQLSQQGERAPQGHESQHRGQNRQRGQERGRRGPRGGWRGGQRGSNESTSFPAYHFHLAGADPATVAALARNLPGPGRERSRSPPQNRPSEYRDRS